MSGTWRLFPLIGVGAYQMPLKQEHIDTVAFICAKNKATGVVEPRGTGFLVSMRGTSGRYWSYLVTAYHVVDDGVQTWARFRRRSDQLVTDDFPLGDWLQHGEADVAITPCDIDMSRYCAVSIEDDVFADRWPHPKPISVGEPIYFIGLLAGIETMGKRAIPMMRSGIIGALGQNDVPVARGKVMGKPEPIAHLIDTYSRSGFSGSPVFVDSAYVVVAPDPVKGHVHTLNTHVALLGLISAHFGGTGGNEGVAVVIPVNRIRDLLHDEALVEWRERRDKEYMEEKEREKWENAATADSLAETNEKESASKKRRSDKFTLHPRGFKDAVREVWEADPETKDATVRNPDGTNQNAD